MKLKFQVPCLQIYDDLNGATSWLNNFHKPKTPAWSSKRPQNDTCFTENMYQILGDDTGDASMILTSNTGDDTDIHIFRVNYRRSLYRQVVDALNIEHWMESFTFIHYDPKRPTIIATNHCWQCREPRRFLDMVWPLIALGWEMRFTEDHVRYFVDHNTR